MQTIYRGNVLDVQASPDGRYVICRCTDNPQVSARWRIVSVNDPSTSVDVVKGRVSNDPIALAWVGPPRRPLHYTSLHIDAGSDTIPLGAPFQLLATGVDAGGRASAVSLIRWHSSDSRIATVDSTGLITPRRTGTVRVDATTGSWVSASRAFVIADIPPKTLATFDWSTLDDSRIIPFGDPKPIVVNDHRMGRSLLINGDDSFTSGIVTSPSFDGRDGLAIETTVSAPISAMQWQAVTVALDPRVDSTALAKWNRRTGAVPIVTTSSPCGIIFPAAEGPDGLHQIDVGFGGAPAPPRIGSGQPFRLLVQLFTDGRCGIAIDGFPVAIAPTRPPADRRYRVSIAGYSFGTRILVGRVVLSSGIRPGINWSDAPAAKQR